MFLEFAGIIYRNYCMWEEMYIDIPCLKDVVRRKHPKIWKTNNWFILHDNAPAHQSVLVKAFYAKNVPTLELPPHSPDLAPAGFYLLPQLQSAISIAGMGLL
jgi:hypothetical protein